MKENFTEDEIIRCWKENNILFAEFKVPVLDLHSAKVGVITRGKVGNGGSYPLMVDARLVKSITKEARDYFASEEGSQYLLASALVLDSVLGRFLGNFFIQISKPKIPLKLFTNPEDAMKWLQQFKPKKDK